MLGLAFTTIILSAVTQVLCQDSNTVEIGHFLVTSLTFDPEFVNLERGSLLQMDFWDRRDWQLRESTFEEPCTWGGSFWSLNITGDNRSVLEFKTVMLDVWSGLGDDKSNHSFWFFDAQHGKCKTEGAIFAINPPSESAFKDASNRAISGDILFGGDPVTSFPPVTTAPVPPTSVSTSDTPSATATATSARSATPSGSSSNSTGDSPKKDDDGNGAIYVDAGKTVVLAAVMGLIGVMGMF